MKLIYGFVKFLLNFKKIEGRIHNMKNRGFYFALIPFCITLFLVFYHQVLPMYYDLLSVKQSDEQVENKETNNTNMIFDKILPDISFIKLSDFDVIRCLHLGMDHQEFIDVIGNIEDKDKINKELDRNKFFNIFG